VQLIIKNSFIIILFITSVVLPNKSYSSNKDNGIIAIMYHRFEENKYPSTNIRLIDFKKHLQLIKNKNFHLVNANNFEEDMKNKKDKKKLLITIDDAFLSFYNNAWPLLKKEKIPFILFVSTREVGKSNYMTWQQIREISKENFVHIGNHSHSHEYLVDLESEKIINDIKKSIKIFKREIGYNSEFFSYPFGEYSLEFKSIIKNLGFNFAFGQHSGVVDETKDFFELPRFPINEKYGSLKRFKTLMNTLPLRVKSILPSEKYINDKTNPPKIIINFYNDVDNLKSINCYSNVGDKWRSSEIKFINDFKLEIVIQEKFTTERGRVNCSLRENNGSWRWLGMQFVIAEK